MYSDRPSISLAIAPILFETPVTRSARCTLERGSYCSVPSYLTAIPDGKATRAELTRRRDTAVLNKFTWQRPSGKSESQESSNGHTHFTQNTGSVKVPSKRSKIGDLGGPWRKLGVALFYMVDIGCRLWLVCIGSGARSWRCLSGLIEGSGLTEALGPQGPPVPMSAREDSTWVLDRPVA